MLYPVLAVIIGLAVLVYSADRFVDGAVGLARYFGMSPLLIGMLIVGFGTSAPEIFVSAISALQGKASLALGNAYGSNIANIALILGVTALIQPLKVEKSLLKKELPMLTVVTLISLLMLWFGVLSRLDAVILLALFAAIMFYTCKTDKTAVENDENLAEEKSLSLPMAWISVIAGIVFLIVSSQVLVWGAVEIARYFNVSEMVIGLTVVAIGTSLPELASSIVAAYKKQHDIVLGNIIGSNLFNTLVVVGIAAGIEPIKVSSDAFSRDGLVMTALTLSLFLTFRHLRIGRLGGILLLLSYIAYNTSVLMIK